MKNKKHNHNWTNLLKVFVFALMILMPFIVFMPNAFYYGFNKYATAQEKTEQVPVYYETKNVNSVEDIQENYIYKWNNNYIDNYTGNNASVFKINTDLLKNQIPYFSTLNLEYATFTLNETQILIIYKEYGGVRTGFNVGSTIFNFIPTEINDRNLIETYLKQYITATDYKYLKEINTITTNMSITDSMSYAWESVWQNDLFSWTRSTAIYTGINTTTNAIGITQQAYLADYLTYIILFTIIYVIIDIILSAFTILTHIFNKEPK